MKKSFSLTLVRYEAGDLVGFALAAISLLPFALLVSLATLCLFRREVHTICFTIAQVTMEAFNIVLKRLLRAPRPKGTDREDHGMPSSHTVFMFFFATYFLLFLFFRKGFRSDAVRCVLFFLLPLLASAVGYSRLYLHYHTNAQVNVGVLVGSCCAVIFFALVESRLRPLFPTLATSRIGKWLKLRDSSHFDDVLAWEYELVQVVDHQLNEGMKQAAGEKKTQGKSS